MKLFNKAVAFLCILSQLSIPLAVLAENGDNQQAASGNINISHWTGNGTDKTCGGANAKNNWSCASNWENGNIPDADSIVIFDTSSNQGSIIDENFQGEIYDLKIEGYGQKITQNVGLIINGSFYQSSGTYQANDRLEIKKDFIQENEAVFIAPDDEMIIGNRFDHTDDFQEQEDTKLYLKDLGLWQAYAQDKIAEREYYPTLQSNDSQGNTFQSPKWHLYNRENNLRSYISTEQGWELSSGDSAAWKFNYQFQNLSRNGEIIETMDPIQTIQEENKTVSIQRSQNITEWYKNPEEGIEQGFTINQKPQGEGNLILSSTVTTNLDIQEKTDNKIFFTYEGASAFDYSDLNVTDSNQQTISARLEIYEIGNNVYNLQVIIEDQDAIYPLTIDPLSTSAAWTAEGNQDTAYFGASVSTAGDVNGDGYSDVIIGAYLYDNGQTDEGAAYLYYGSSSGLSITADWTGEGNQNSSRFGYSVSTAGDVNGDGYSDVIVGASRYDNDQTDEGRSYVYYGSASGPSLSADWTAEGNQETAYFGASVSTAGDVNGDGYSDVIVGANGYDNGQTDEGVAFVYYGSSSGLSFSPDWTVEGNQASTSFSYSVSTAGDVNGDGYSDVIIGAYLYDNGQTDEGRAFVYYGSASGPSSSADWTAESNQTSAKFGVSVSTAGDVNGDGYSDVIVGADYYDNGQTDEGAAFVYYGSASGLSLTADWSVESNQDSANLGRCVSTAGDVNGDGYSDVIVGAHDYSNGQSGEGKVFVYHGSSLGLSASANWTKESGQVNAYLGNVSTAGDVNGDGYSDVIIGAKNYDNGETDEGKASVYYGSASGLSSTSDWAMEGNQAYLSFAGSVSSAGDVNGDGYSDMLIGTGNYSNGQTYEGVVFLYYGSSSGLSLSADWSQEGNQAYAGFSKASSAGDVNGDGYSDVIVGASGYDNTEHDEGAAFLFFGSSSGLSLTATWTQEGNQESAYFGSSVSTAGDVNGDGYSDVIVGAPNYSSKGRSFVYYGSSTGLSLSHDWVIEGIGSAYFGSSVSTAGDVNGDGYSDVIVGACYYDNGQADEGGVFLYHGSSSGLSLSAAWSQEGNQSVANLGYSVFTAGDVNGDGYSDVIVGAYRQDNGETDEGKVYVYHGSSSGLSLSADWTQEGNQASAYFGQSVSTAGDVNGDGYSDVIVGAYQYDNGETDEGKAFLYYGSSSGLSLSADWTAESDQDSANFGKVVSSAGDVNGDGYSDVIVGAYKYDNGQVDEGKAFLYYGNSGSSLSPTPRQLNSSGDPVQINNQSDSDTFKISANASSYMGRTKAKLIYEVKALGDDFDGTGLVTSSSWTDTTLTQATITETISGLSFNEHYHWRARFQYMPYMDYSPWFSVNTTSNESDIYIPEQPTIQFTSASSSESESTTSINIELTLDKTWSSDVTVNYALTGTATGSGTDYTLSNGTATISSGDATTDISLTITDDNIYEQNETVILTLSSPTNATLGTNTVHTYTITEDDSQPTVTISANDSSIFEDSGISTLTATLSNTSYQDVTINLSFSGTAVNATDYTRSSETITISAGDTTGTITMTAVNDDAYEETDRTIIIDIDAITNGTESGTQQQTITIVEDDSSPGGAFVPPVKPDISDISIKIQDGSINLENLPDGIAYAAISETDDFSDSSWIRIEDNKINLSDYKGNIYLRFRTTRGAVSDIIEYNVPNDDQYPTLLEGDIVKTNSSFDVYIIKYNNNKKYKRLILSPTVFNSYQHLKWENIKTISEEQLDLYATSNLVNVKGDNNIYYLTPDGDTGTKQIVATYVNGVINTQILKQVQDDTEIDVDSVYEINEVDRDSYDNNQ